MFFKDIFEVFANTCKCSLNVFSIHFVI
uniref:Uncharacterized protein n=1 Tax=Anguilla anguilla TaxID=7936 RepID=A0A0E9P988_ANGAN